MHKLLKHLISILACSLVPAFITILFFLCLGLFANQLTGIFHKIPNIFMLIFMVSTAHAVLLGLPTYLILKSFFRFTYITAAISGFLIGAIPTAIFTWPLKFSSSHSSSFNGVQHMIEGTPTMAGWLSYIQGFVVFGLLGITGALTYNYLLNKQKL